MQPDSNLSINAVEGYPLENFSAEVGSPSTRAHDARCSIFRQSVKSQISEAQKIAGGSGSQQDIAEANIELEVNMSLEL